MSEIRQFETGATRDTKEGKPDYEGFLSPLVLRRYAQYMHQHRKQSDGNLRASDNWQKLYGENHYGVCMSSLLRHVMDLWLSRDGFTKLSRGDMQESLCAIMFNCMAYLFKLLKEEYEQNITGESK